MEREVMHFRDSLNSYNVNAQVNYPPATIIKPKTLIGWYTPVFAMLKNKVRLLTDLRQLPPKGLAPPAPSRRQLLIWNPMKKN
jgi:hypothetical protein